MHTRRGTATSVVATICVVTFTVIALFATTVGVADAQRNQTRTRQVDQRPVPSVETLRLACSPDSINGQRGVLCKWSEATNPNTRAYQLYRIVDGSARQLLTTVTPDGRKAFFDTDVHAPSSLVYGVVSFNRSGRLIGRSEAVHVQYGSDQVPELRFACQPDAIGDQRGVLCQWSESQVGNTRGYLVWRSVDGGPREIIARVGLDGRLASFDRDITPGAAHTYAVQAVDGAGRVVGFGGPQTVRWPVG